MVCFDDTQSHMAWSWLCVAAAGYAGVLVFTSVRWWFKVFIGMTLSVFIYSLLRYWSNTFSDDWEKRLPAEGFLTLAFIAAASCCADMVVLVLATLLVVPILSHNGEVLGALLREHVWAGLPTWIGTALFVVCTLLFVFVVHRTRSIRWIALRLCILVASGNLVMALALAEIENFPDMDRPEVCCWDSELVDRCPLTFLHTRGFTALAIASSLWGALEYAVYVVNGRSCCGRRMGYHAVPQTEPKPKCKPPKPKPTSRGNAHAHRSPPPPNPESVVEMEECGW